MVLDPSRRNDPVTTDGRSYILHQPAAGECERWHPPGREPPARERRRCVPAKSAGYSAATQHPARRPARRAARTTAALLFDEGEAREKDVLKYLTQGQIRLELCRDLL